MNLSSLIVDRKAFLTLRSQSEDVFDTKKRLPDIVFRHTFAKYLAIEYGFLYRAEFGNSLYRMTERFGDGQVNYLTIDPDPGEDYFQNFSHFGAASFNPQDLKEGYVPTMYSDQGAPKLLVSANVGIFWGSSLSWAIMCDRVSWELALIAVSEAVDAFEGIRRMDSLTLKNFIRSQYSAKDPTVADDFVDKLISNYRI